MGNQVISHIKLLDLSYGAFLTPEIATLYNKIAGETRSDYIQLIESVSAQNLDNMSWWYSAPASRDIFITKTFHYCCAIRLIKKLLEDNVKIDKIIINDKVFAQIIIKQICGNNSISIKLKKHSSIKYYLLPFYSLLLSLYQKICVLLFNNHNKLKQDSVLIDTYVLPGYEHINRCYPNMLDFLAQKDINKIFFLPKYSNFTFKNSLSCILRMKKSEINYILRENVLKIFDYLKAFKNSLFCANIEIKNVYFDKIELSQLLLSEYYDIKHFSKKYESHLRFLLIKRIHQQKTTIKKFIIWFENQPWDKAYAKAISLFFPNVPNSGYQAFFWQKFLFCFQPTAMEAKANVIPKEIAGTGKGSSLDIREFNKTQNVCLAPAYRFSHVHNKQSYKPSKDEISILVGLPIFPNLVREILKQVITCNDNLTQNNIIFKVKFHPACSADKISFPKDSLPTNFSIVEDNFDVCLDNCHILLSSSSSICMEAIARGIPLIIMENKYGLSEKSISPHLKSDIYRYCLSSEDITEAILHFTTRTSEQQKQQNQTSSWIREHYFIKPTRQNTLEFLNL